MHSWTKQLAAGTPLSGHHTGQYICSYSFHWESLGYASWYYFPMLMEVTTSSPMFLHSIIIIWPESPHHYVAMVIIELLEYSGSDQVKSWHYHKHFDRGPPQDQVLFFIFYNPFALGYILWQECPPHPQFCFVAPKSDLDLGKDRCRQ